MAFRKIPVRFGRKYRAASKIQKAWRRKKRFQRDSIKTVSDVRRAVNKGTPSSVIIQETNFSLTTTPTVQHVLSDIEYSNSNDTPNTRKSKKITVGHYKFRCYLDVGDRTNLCRVMVVRNKDPQTAAAFNPANMFEMNNGVGTQPTNMFAEPNLRAVEIKYDKVFNLQDSSETVPATRVSNIYFQFSVKCNEVFKYFTETNNTSELTRNMKDYYVVAFSDSSILPNPSFRCVSYTWFKNHTR